MAEEHILQADRAKHGEHDARDEPRTGTGQTADALASAGYPDGNIESAQKHGDHHKKLKELVGNEIAEIIHERLFFPVHAGYSRSVVIISLFSEGHFQPPIIY